VFAVVSRRRTVEQTEGEPAMAKANHRQSQVDPLTTDSYWLLVRKIVALDHTVAE